MKAVSTAGWLTAMLGTALWGYGLLDPGTPPLLDWPALSPPWLSDYLLNIESELGLLLSTVGMIVFYGGQYLRPRRESQQPSPGSISHPD